MPLRKLSHIGIAVRSIEQSRWLYETGLGLNFLGEETVATQDVKVAMFDAGGVRIELLEPLSSTGPIGKFLQKRGPGLHHLAFDTDNASADLTQLAQGGIQAIRGLDEQGAENKRVIFLDPKSTLGTLIELCEHFHHSDQE